MSRLRSRRTSSAETDIQDVEPTAGEIPTAPSWWRRLVSRRASVEPSRNDATGSRQGTSRVAWQHGDVVATRALHALLVVALVAGPTALAWQAVGRPQGNGNSATGQSAVSAAASSPDGAIRAAAAAQRLVFLWLTASTVDLASLQQLTLAPLPALKLPESKPAAPVQLWVESTVEVRPSRYRVVIGTANRAGGVDYFAVPVMVGDATIAATLPARTTPPDKPQRKPDSPAVTALSDNDPAYSTVAGYVTAYLTGSPEVDRWTSPESGLAAISPKACARVQLDQAITPEAAAASPGTQLAVLATATCVAPDNGVTTSQYGLLLNLRDGRWEVSGEDPGLLVAIDEPQSPSPDLSNAPTPSTR